MQLIDLPAFSALERGERGGVPHLAGARDSKSAVEAAAAGLLLLPLPELSGCFVEGPDASDYLQRLSSQDVLKLGIGSAAPALFLNPKGRILASVQVLRLQEERFFLASETACLDKLLETLELFHFTERLATMPLDPDWGAIAWIGDEAHRLAGLAEGGGAREEGGLVYWSDESWGRPFARVLGPIESLSRLADERLASGAVPGAFREFEFLRVQARVPAFGKEIEERSLPLELGLGDACDPDKGCYTGQEVITRIRSMGHVNRQLARVRVPEASAPPESDRIYDEDMEAGRMCTVVRDPLRGGLLGLALLPAIVLDGETELRLGGPSGPVLELLDGEPS